MHTRCDVLYQAVGSLLGRTDQSSQREDETNNGRKKSTWENRPKFPTWCFLLGGVLEVYLGEPTKVPNSGVVLTVLVEQNPAVWQA
jgi:hypothetical protein